MGRRQGRRRPRVVVTHWLLLGKTASGDYKWKRASDSAIYYADQGGGLSRNSLNHNTDFSSTGFSGTTGGCCFGRAA